MAYDQISRKAYEEPLEATDSVDLSSEEGDSVRIVRLVKEEQEPLVKTKLISFHEKIDNHVM